MSADAFAPSSPRFLDVARRLDPRVLLPVAVLVLLGLASIASAKPELLLAQVGGVAVGIAVLAAVLLLPYRGVLALAWPLYLVSIALLAVVLVPGIGAGVNGARRWLRVGGVQFQPSELAKVAHVLVLATYVRFRRDQRTVKGLVVPFLLTLVPMALVVQEPDLGTALLLVPVLFATLWAAGARTRHLLLVVGLGIASLPLLYLSLRPYQQDRVRTFLPFVTQLEEDHSGRAVAAGDAYHVRESQFAVAGGRLLGQGWREGRQNVMERVPENWTDFVFAVHAEEWGFVGVLVLVLAEAGLLLGLASLARELKEPAARLLCVGAMVLLGVQASLNLLMTMGLAPVTGVPLPFVSYGRSAMLSSWLLVALALNARARQPFVFTSRDFD